MVIAVLTVLVVAVALIVAKIVPVLVGIVLMIVGLIAVVAMAERRDRTRRGIHDVSQRLDANRASIPASLEFSPGDQLDTYADVHVAATLSDRSGSRPPSD